VQAVDGGRTVAARYRPIGYVRISIWNITKISSISV